MIIKPPKGQKPWTKEEDKILLDAHEVMTISQVSELLPNRTETTIRRKCGLAGVRLLRGK